MGTTRYGQRNCRVSSNISLVLVIYTLGFQRLTDFHLGRLIDIRDENHRFLARNRKILKLEKKTID